MAVPKGKVSKARRNKRRANWKLVAPNLSSVPAVHTVCLTVSALHVVCTTVVPMRALRPMLR